MLLWQNVIELKLDSFSRVADNRRYLFESGRSALYFLLKDMKRYDGITTILVCRFTCPAVLDAITAVGLKPIFYDINSELTINVDPIKLIESLSLSDQGVAFLVQATFGKLSVSGEEITKIENEGFLVIVDLALANGTHYDGQDLKCLSSCSFTSYECSKAISFGWGGEVFLNGWNDRSSQSYKKNQTISITADLQRLFQTFIMIRRPFFERQLIPDLIRKALILIRLFRRSSSSSTETCLGKSIGPLTRRWLVNAWPKVKHRRVTIAEAFDVSKLVLSSAFFVPSYEHYGPIVSPRVPFFVSVNSKEKVLRAGSAAGIEIGTWFENYVDGSGKAIFDVHKQKMVCLNLPIAKTVTPKKLHQFIELCK